MERLQAAEHLPDRVPCWQLRTVFSQHQRPLAGIQGDQRYRRPARPGPPGPPGLAGGRGDSVQHLQLNLGPA